MVRPLIKSRGRVSSMQVKGHHTRGTFRFTRQRRRPAPRVRPRACAPAL
jgi:hypothetical protein